MIQSILYFIVFSGLFYAVYKALLANKSFFESNRALLLAIPAISAAIAVFAPQYTLPAIYPTQIFVLPEIQVVGAQGGMNFRNSASDTDVWLWGYLIIAAGLLVYTVFGLVQLLNLLKNSEKVEPNIYLSHKATSAFNFANTIVIPKHLQESNNYRSILLHEQAHRKQKHYLDNLYYHLFSITAWFNPFIHLLAKELRQVHECQADAAVIREENIENYAHTLLSSTLGGDIGFTVRALSASPFFNSSLIKTRITMIYKNKSPKWQRALYLCLLPLIAGMTLMACNKTESLQEQEAQQKIIPMNEVEMLPLPAGTGEVSLEESQMAFQQAVIGHISKNFKYPEEARELGMEGRVYVGFVINKQGEITEVNIKRGLLPGGKDEAGNPQVYSAAEKAAAKATDSQVITLVQGMPDFEQPAMKDGQPVAMSFTLPIALKLPPEVK